MLLLVLAAYFVGAIPFGYLVGKAKGKDVRKEGSGNIGATNVGRIFGKKYFWLVFLLDMSKGLIPMIVGKELSSAPEYGELAGCIWWMGVAIAVILGHMFPIYLGFKGGKGVATSLGVMLGVFPYYTLAAVPAVGVFLLVRALTRIISISSILGSAAFPVFLAITGFLMPQWHIFTTRWPLLAVAIAMATLVIVRHRANIARLRAGTEPRIAPKRSEGLQ